LVTLSFNNYLIHKKNILLDEVQGEETITKPGSEEEDKRIEAKDTIKSSYKSVSAPISPKNASETLEDHQTRRIYLK
jgi:hypothetical protein